MVESTSESHTSSLEHVHLLHQYPEQLYDIKAEHGSIRQAVLTTGAVSLDDLFSTVSKLDKGIFDAMLNFNKLP